jgi:hypothetical protein
MHVRDLDGYSTGTTAPIAGCAHARQVRTQEVRQELPLESRFQQDAVTGSWKPFRTTVSLPASPTRFPQDHRSVPFSQPRVSLATLLGAWIADPARRVIYRLLRSGPEVASRRTGRHGPRLPRQPSDRPVINRRAPAAPASAGRAVASVSTISTTAVQHPRAAQPGGEGVRHARREAGAVGSAARGDGVTKGT